MTRFQRGKLLVGGTIMLAVAGVMLFLPNVTCNLIMLFLGLGFLVSAVSMLWYYFTMARYMVGGKMTLYKGIIFADFALLTLSLTDVPRLYILLYLAVIHGFSGIIEILRAREARLNGTKRFKLKLIHGIVNVVIALSCIIFVKNTNTAVFIYGIGLVYSALCKITTAFRRTTFIYIQ